VALGSQLNRNAEDTAPVPWPDMTAEIKVIGLCTHEDRRNGTNLEYFPIDFY
jgi:hypothetical protein